MRNTTLLALSLLAAAATLASAGGLNLRWSDCAADGGTQNRTFACNTNVGTSAFVGSFVLDQDVQQVNGNESILDIQFADATVPQWWTFRNPGSCRLTALSIAAQDGVSCPDPFSGQASMNIATYQLGIQGMANWARLLCVNGVQQIHIVDLTGGQEYGLARWTITNAKTVGTGSCGGCTTEATIEFRWANITTDLGLNDTNLTEGADPGSNFITWQALPTATRNTTWGAVKSLYR